MRELEALLAPTLAAAVRVILNPHPERVVSLLKIIRHIEGKGEIAVFIFSEKVAVPPDTASLIHSSEMKQPAASCFWSYLFRKTPFYTIKTIRLLNCLPTPDSAASGENGTNISPFIFFGNSFVSFYCIFPHTVQIHTTFPAHQWSWIFP